MQADSVWSRIKEIVARVFKAAHYQVNMKSELCYKLYGVDILLDAQLKPWLLEVNQSPDMFFYTEHEDKKVKSRVVEGIIAMMATTANDTLPQIAGTYDFEIL